MSSYQGQNLGLGLAPALLPVTGSFLFPFAMLNGFLSFNVVRQRLSSKVYIGDKSNNPSLPPTAGSASPRDELQLAGRIHANFIENIPLAIAFAAIIELNGGNRRALTAALSSLLALRVSHFLGLNNEILAFRAAGYFGTMGSLIGLGGWAAYLSKGYWGF